MEGFKMAKIDSDLAQERFIESFDRDGLIDLLNRSHCLCPEENELRDYNLNELRDFAYRADPDDLDGFDNYFQSLQETDEPIKDFWDHCYEEHRDILRGGK